MQTRQFGEATQGLTSCVYFPSCVTLSGKVRIFLIVVLVQVWFIDFHLRFNLLRWKILDNKRGEENRDLLGLFHPSLAVPSPWSGFFHLHALELFGSKS